MTIFTCKRCGTRFVVEGNPTATKYCKPCRPLAIKEWKQKQWLRRKKEQEETKIMNRDLSQDYHFALCDFMVMHDPDTEYGFRPGARFNGMEVESMKSMMSFTVGTILRDLSSGNMITITY